MVTPPKGRKLTPNVTGTERISQGGALAVRKPNTVQKAKDLAGDAKNVIKDKVKGAKEKLKNVKLKNPIPKPVTDYAVPVGVGVGIHKSLNREDYEPFDLVLDYLVETQQVDSVEEALYVMMEMDQDVIYGIVQEKTVPAPLKKVAKKAVDEVKKKVSKSVKDTGSFLKRILLVQGIIRDQMMIFLEMDFHNQRNHLKVNLRQKLLLRKHLDNKE